MFSQFPHAFSLSFRIFISSSKFFIIFCKLYMFFSSIYSFTLAFNFMFFAFAAKFNVDRVYEKNPSFAETVANNIVFEFPPSESFSIFVSIESLYGIWVEFVANFSITMLKSVRDRFILDAYLSLSPYTSVIFCFYEPAKSTKWILDDFTLFIATSLVTIFKVRMECDLEEMLFILVSAIDLFLSPFLSSLIIYSQLSTFV